MIAKIRMMIMDLVLDILEIDIIIRNQETFN
jgi:hypothetical protein